MKRIRILRMMLFFGICFFLTGCPRPNPYKVFIRNYANELFPNDAFTTELYNYKVLDAYPFLDSKKKIITINCSINNISNQNLIIDIKSIKLESKKKEIFKLITTDINLINPFKVDSSRLNIKPKHSSLILFYFISYGNYTKKDYRKSLVNDTLIFMTSVLKERNTVYLVH